MAAVKGELVDRRDSYASARAGKAQLLANTQASRQELEDHVDSLQREQAAVLARLHGGSGVAGPIRQGSGQLIWPANGSISSGFGMRWGRLHAGIDMPLPEGTGLRAAAGGTVAIAGWVGGYGNYTCIQHGGGLSTCYGHQSSISVSVGQSVSQGQVIGGIGQHRPQHGAAPALRGAHQRVPGGPAGLPVAPANCGSRSLNAAVDVRYYPHSLMQPEIDLGPITLQTFGLMMGLGFVVAGLAASKFLKEIGKPVDWAYEMVFAALVGGIVGARLWWVAENWSDAKDDILGSLFSGAGLVWYGGAIGGAVAVLLWARWRHFLTLQMFDVAAVPLAIGYAIGRIGCQLAGDGDYGIPWDGPWAMAYPNGTVPTTEEVHPTPVYETLAMGLVALLLWRWRHRWRAGHAVRALPRPRRRRALPRRVRPAQRRRAARPHPAAGAVGRDDGRRRALDLAREPPGGVPGARTRRRAPARVDSLRGRVPPGLLRRGRRAQHRRLRRA